MKEQFEKNNKIKIIAMALLSIIIIGATISLFYVNKNQEINKLKEKNTSSTTSSTTPKKDPNSNVEAISIENTDYYESDCGVAYYIPEFIIYEDVLYAGIDEKSDLTKNLKTIDINNRKGYKLIDNVENAFFVEEGQCGFQFAFASGKDGKFYYINNYRLSKSKILEVLEIKELKNIKEVESLEEDDAICAYAKDKNGKEYRLDDIIDKYAKLEKGE